jgi:hypothetical protein
MRWSLLAVAAVTAPVLALGVLPGAEGAAVQASTGTDARVNAVSCAPGGGCAAGGRFFDASLGAGAFVLTETNGQWGTAAAVPGLTGSGLTTARVSAVSCATGGCVAGGYYQDTARRYHAFVTSEVNGQWSREVTVFTAAKVRSKVVQVGSLACSGPGTCIAGGGQPAFVVSEVHGRWGSPHEFGASGMTGHARVSCTSAGSCSAAWGRYVVSERNGRWGTPVPVPGLGALGTKPAIASLSCTSAVNCAVGGTFWARQGRGPVEVFVASERNGHWGTAIAMPGFTALDHGFGELAALRCISAGNCVAGGSYIAPADFAGGVYEPFVASERNGHWGNAIEVPGIPPATSTLCEPDSSACVAGQVFSVACSPGGTCAVGGSYDTTQISGDVAFVALYRNGRWSNVTQIPGLAALETSKQSAVNSVSCTPTGKCVAGGSYPSTDVGDEAGFVADEENGTWGQVQTVGFGS